MTDQRAERGLALLRQVANSDRPAVLDAMADIAPDLGRFTVEFAFGDVLSRPGLPLPDRQLATVAALTALGTAAPQLRFHVGGALTVGCSAAEIVEAIMHVCLYAGFPATLNALTIAREVFTEAAVLALEPSETDHAAGDRYDRGWKALGEIDGAAGEQIIAGLADIAPDLGRYIVEFAFGDIYPRPGLDLRRREIVTVAATTALGTAPAQLAVHIDGLLNVGGTTTDVVETIMQMAIYAGFPAALNGIAVAKQVFEKRIRSGHST
jgi:4-carboxymuconolactone decarboxylase